MSRGWLRWFFIGLLVATGIWSVYHYARSHLDDGDPCERDFDCPGETCMRESDRTYCSRPCASGGDCPPAWRCLEPVGRSGLHCIMPRH